MEFGDFPEKFKNDEKPKRRFFTRRVLLWMDIAALLYLLLFLFSEFWVKPIFQAMVISCTFP